MLKHTSTVTMTYIQIKKNCTGGTALERSAGTNPWDVGRGYGAYTSFNRLKPQMNNRIDFKEEVLFTCTLQEHGCGT